MTLPQAGGITTNRGMRQKTFNERGLSYVSELALQNVKDLETIVKWNEEMGIKLFRMSKFKLLVLIVLLVLMYSVLNIGIFIVVSCAIILIKPFHCLNHI